MVICMTTLLDKAFARARALPEDEQDAVAGAVMDYLDTSPQLQLSDEQVAEVLRRRARGKSAYVPLDEARKRLLNRSR